MRKALFWLVLTVCLSLLAATVASAARYSDYSRSELDELMAPIALYPDPLLAQILPAATYPDQIDDAHQRLRGRTDARYIDDEDWDVSVKAVAHYPDILDMMYDDQDWTVAVGQAYAEQPDDVFDAIQRLRLRAYRVGTLTTTREQRVVIADDGTVLIVPAQAERIYVPRYHPQQVYVESRDRDDRNVLIAFGLGLLIGSWLDRDVDWHHHRVYYHGWQGGGWIARSRRHVVLIPVYVNPRWHRDYVPHNRRIIDRPNVRFRERIRHDAEINRPVYASGRRPSTGRFVQPERRSRTMEGRPPVILHKTPPPPKHELMGVGRARGRSGDMPVQSHARGGNVTPRDAHPRTNVSDRPRLRDSVRTERVTPRNSVRTERVTPRDSVRRERVTPRNSVRTERVTPGASGRNDQGGPRASGRGGKSDRAQSADQGRGKGRDRGSNDKHRKGRGGDDRGGRDDRGR
jgi:hypothetical protein